MYKEEMYSGVNYNWSPEYIPVDLFSEKGQFQHKIVSEARIKQGDCIYIPSLHWFQSQTTGEEEYPESALLIFDFEASSELSNLVAKSLFNKDML